jgi:hypothetical protein
MQVPPDWYCVNMPSLVQAAVAGLSHVTPRHGSVVHAPFWQLQLTVCDT